MSGCDRGFLSVELTACAWSVIVCVCVCVCTVKFQIVTTKWVKSKIPWV